MSGESVQSRDATGSPGRPERGGEWGAISGPPILVGVDVGGTTITAGAVSVDGDVLHDESVLTHDAAAAGTLVTIERLVQRVSAAMASRGLTVSGIGVGVPGPVDVDAGRVNEPAPHAADLIGQPLVERLAARFGVPVFVDNDVNALALAEWRFGAGRDTRSLVVLAPGTGFGAGVILDGRLVRGVAGFGGEFGHAPVKFDGPPCWCGGRGCLAVYASGRGIAEAARARVAGHAESPLLRTAGGAADRITAELVFRAAADGEPVAMTVVDEACRALGAMLATIVNGLNPDVVVVTGGVAASLAALEKRILAAAAEHAFARALAATRISIVPGDKRLTMRGGAALVLYERERRRG
jgi:glucokinase-like ROK family protein